MVLKRRLPVARAASSCGNGLSGSPLRKEAVFEKPY